MLGCFGLIEQTMRTRKAIDGDVRETMPVKTERKQRNGRLIDTGG